MKFHKDDIVHIQSLNDWDTDNFDEVARRFHDLRWSMPLHFENRINGVDKIGTIIDEHCGYMLVGFGSCNGYGDVYTSYSIYRAIELKWIPHTTLMGAERIMKLRGLAEWLTI